MFRVSGRFAVWVQFEPLVLVNTALLTPPEYSPPAYQSAPLKSAADPLYLPAGKLPTEVQARPSDVLKTLVVNVGDAERPPRSHAEVPSETMECISNKPEIPADPTAHDVPSIVVLLLDEATPLKPPVIHS